MFSAFSNHFSWFCHVLQLFWDPNYPCVHILIVCMDVHHPQIWYHLYWPMPI